MKAAHIIKIILVIQLALMPLTSFAKKKKVVKSSRPAVASIHPNSSSLVVDAKTGEVLHSVRPNKPVYPASLTKLMTAYIILEKVKLGKLKLNTQMTASKKACAMKPTKLGLKPGEKITVHDAVHALNIKSANDAAVTIAEHIAGSEKSFVKLMNKKARKLGMKNTNFENASGWHHPNQKTTASDLAKIAIAIKREFPEYMSWFKKNSFEYKGRVVKGHNKVNVVYSGAEGMKTGYTCPSGYNLVTAASRDGRNLIGVVTGEHTHQVRDKKMMKMLDKYFDSHKTSADVFAVATNKNTNGTKTKVANISKAKNSKVKLSSGYLDSAKRPNRKSGQKTI
jgi:serine-type D-Ala-D-Ala carboxypeptidase (penicillin-binding protein 5/6)